MARGGIPLKMFGVDVGTARINDDGTADLIMISPCPFGQDVLAGFENGIYQSLSLMPSGIPMPPQPSSPAESQIPDPDPTPDPEPETEEPTPDPEPTPEEPVPDTKTQD